MEWVVLFIIDDDYGILFLGDVNNFGIIVDVGWEYVAFGRRKSHHQAGQGQVTALLRAAQLRDDPHRRRLQRPRHPHHLSPLPRAHRLPQRRISSKIARPACRSAGEESSTAVAGRQVIDRSIREMLRLSSRVVEMLEASAARVRASVF